MFNCLSISYKKAGVSVRENLAFSAQKQEKFLKKLEENGAEQGVIICTCNRCEVYFSDMNFYKVMEILSEFSDIPYRELSGYVMNFTEKNAIKHLFYVACGIDSMVIGEDEILGQTKNAYAFSKSLGMTGYKFNMIFQAAVTCAKKIKTETMLSKTSVSPATLGAKLCWENFRNKENPQVLIIGASGKTGSTVLKNLLSYGIFNIIATERTHGMDLSCIKSCDNLKIVPYNDRYSYMDLADCIISCTNSPHFTVTSGKFLENVKVQKNRLLIDLAVPPDIDGELSENSDKNHCTLVGIDYFETLAEENNRIKLDSVKSAEEIIEEETDTLFKNLDFHKFIPQMGILENKSAQQLVYHLKSSLNAQEFHSVLESLKKF